MSTPRRAPELMGIAEVVEASGLAKSTVSMWASTKPPAGIPPHADLACGPVWRASDMLAWLRSTDRLKS